MTEMRDEVRLTASAPPSSPAGAVEPVGEAGTMAGSNGGFTIAVFQAAKVPVGTKLYTDPPPAVRGAVTEAMVEAAAVDVWCMMTGWDLSAEVRKKHWLDAAWKDEDQQSANPEADVDIVRGRDYYRAIARAALAAAPPAQAEPASGWIVANGAGNRWRAWSNMGPSWTDDRDQATRFARRVDAEAVHGEDEYAWLIQPYAAQPDALERVTAERGAIERFNAIIDTVEARCLAADGPVTPTLQEMREDELSGLWRCVQAIRAAFPSTEGR